MQSSYKVILKGESIERTHTKKILTDYTSKKKPEENTEMKIYPVANSYENLGRTILEDANRKKESILNEAYEKSSQIEKQAKDNGYKTGYVAGMKKGREDGYKSAYEEGYEKNFNEAKKQGEAIKKNAESVLNSAIQEKQHYLKEKEAQIKQLIVNAVENILRHEIIDKDSLNDAVFDALRQMRNTNTFVVKSRKKYSEEFKKHVDIWKEQMPFKGDIFVIPDESVEEGTVIIERDSGKMVLGIDIACDKLKQILENEG
ncbi:flagellar assembly protein FliH [Clostridium tyrobutyricum]|uniref:FliH/SctL family protein n=1 Tax=Clostridium tyrobutyricum TaxID=1519 RepID=UPI001C37EA59|nr:flagellar assembly protein FliH [Clostridium tyrobutyricum]MBV4419142.1 flagellar assembly protein FliH [Clostridium tyrobutyricum]